MMMLKSTSLFALGIYLVTLGCGGQKETLKYNPPATVEEEPIAEEPATIEEPEETKQPEEDLLTKKEPVILENVYFDFDRSELTPEAKRTLAQNAQKLVDSPELKIRIEGHCDERGTVEYNLALGERRALSAKNYLINYGIAPGRIAIISYGKERPADPGHNPEAWSKNRRDEFVILNQ
ncbi:MAG: peptidoglycan-associated lipoprotein Pal [bacterium]